MGSWYGPAASILQRYEDGLDLIQQSGKSERALTPPTFIEGD